LPLDVLVDRRGCVPGVAEAEEAVGLLQLSIRIAKTALVL
jgi:hypothetical protein